MTRSAEDLEVPILLIATPQVQDPFFHHSVVLLLGHNTEGSFGFNVNRPTTVSVAEILEGLDLPWAGDPEAVSYFGGPVQPQLGSVLFEPEGEETLPRPEMKETSTEIEPGVRMTQHVDDLAFLARQPPDRFRLYLGYAGWGAGQLVDEILRNDWILGPLSRDLIFADDPNPVWEGALEAAGVDPETLPSWTPPAAGGASN